MKSAKLGDHIKKTDLESLQILPITVVLFSSTFIWFMHQWLSSVTAVQVLLPRPSSSGSATRADVL